MPASEVVSDTGPLISLEKLPDGFSLLRLLFSRVLVPPSVLTELQGASPGRDYLAHHGLTDLVVVVPEAKAWSHPDAVRLDRGERDAIALSVERRCPLLIEERIGRRLALENGLRVVGAAGLIVEARRRELIEREAALRFAQGLYRERRIGRRLYEDLAGRLR